MKLIALPDSRGRKVLRLKQSRAELRAELERLQAKHRRFLRLSRSVESLMIPIDAKARSGAE